MINRNNMMTIGTVILLLEVFHKFKESYMQKFFVKEFNAHICLNKDKL